MADPTQIDRIRADVGNYHSGTGADRQWVKDHAVGWVNTLLAHIRDLEVDLANAHQERNQLRAVPVTDLDFDPTVCRCASVAMPPCGPCENGVVVLDGVP